MRFYKGSANTGTHTGNLWSASGTLLASVTFTGESASGWQQALFSAPVAITAGTTYVVSYHAPNGNYSTTRPGFSSEVGNYPLRGLADSAGGNGVYRYGASGFPTGSYQATNYWVDVVYAQTAVDTTAPSVTSRTPAAGATNVATSAVVTATFDEAVVPASIVFELRNGSGALVPASVSYDAPTRTARLTPSQALAFGVTFTATLSGGADAAGNVMTSTSWSFTTAAGPPSVATSVFAASAVPAVASSGDASAVELGMKFRSDLDGFIRGVRFYKGAANTGTHTGNLWSASGTLLRA